MKQLKFQIKKFYLKKAIQLFILSLSSFLFSQSTEIKDIDHLLQKAENSRRRFQNLDQLKYAKEANTLAKSIQNSEKISESYYAMARALSFLEMQKESFRYINKTLQEPYAKKNKCIQAQLGEVKAFNYYSLGLTSQFNKELLNVIKLLKNENSKEAVILRQRTYLNLGAIKPDSALYYSQLTYHELKKFPEKEIHLELSDYYKYMGTDFMDHNKADSTLYYFNKSFQINIKYKDPVLFLDYTSFGDYFAQQKQYKRAIEYYKKAIENIKQQSVTPYHFVNNSLYKKIADLYDKLGDEEQKIEYEKTYSKLQRQLLEARDKNIEEAIKVILSDQDKKHKERENNNYFLIAALVLVLLLFLVFLYKILNNNIRQKENMITQVTDYLNEKDEIISKNSLETQELHQKINDSYNELIQLAKNNHPDFYTRFQQIYPEFNEKLLQKSPGLRTSELILCAYTFLGFTIKDIADYTSKSIHTVRNRKQNLRKKFNIPTELDMGIWLREIIKNNT